MSASTGLEAAFEWFAAWRLFGAAQAELQRAQGAYAKAESDLLYAHAQLQAEAGQNLPDLGHFVPGLEDGA